MAAAYFIFYLLLILAPPLLIFGGLAIYIWLVIRVLSEMIAKHAFQVLGLCVVTLMAGWILTPPQRYYEVSTGDLLTRSERLRHLAEGGAPLPPVPQQIDVLRTFWAFILDPPLALYAALVLSGLGMWRFLRVKHLRWQSRR